MKGLIIADIGNARFYIYVATSVGVVDIGLIL